MRALFFGLLALALTACSRQPDVSASAGCSHEHVSDVTFSNPETPDRVTAQTEGPNCAEAAATLTIRSAEGKLLWVFAAPLRSLHFGDGGMDGYAPTAEQVQQFLGSWTDLTLARTGDLPEWTEGADSLTSAVQGMSYDTYLGREAYEELRGRNLPEVCFAISAEGSECLIIDPANNEALSMVRFGP